MKKRKWLAALLALTLSMSAVAGATSQTMPTAAAAGNVAADTAMTSVVDLTVNYKENPLGIEQEDLRFGWKMDSNRIGAEQAAYQIKVHKDAPDGEPVWDSGSVPNGKSVGIAYEGAPLEPETRYYWSVTVTDSDGRTYQSDAAWFETGADWTDAGWITTQSWVDGTGVRAPLFRTERALTGDQVASARLYITALGNYEAYINGREVMQGEKDFILAPGNNDYTQYINYQTYDVTDYLDGDTLAFGAIVGSGWYGSSTNERSDYDTVLGEAGKKERALLAKLVIDYQDGTSQVIETGDGEWYTSDTTPYIGEGIREETEDFDARISNAIMGWNEPGYQPAEGYRDWTAAAPISCHVDSLRSNDNGLIYHYKELPLAEAYTYNEADNLPASDEYRGGEVVKIDSSTDLEEKPITVQAGDTLILDFHQNSSAVPCLELEGPAGTNVSIETGEVISDGQTEGYPKGVIFPLISGMGGKGYNLVLSGQRDSHEAEFHFVSYAALSITADQEITVYGAKSIAVSSVGKETGLIETSNSLLNQFVSNAKWSQTSNYCSLITDCPQREYRGWSGDVQIFAESGIYNFDTTATIGHYIELMNEYFNEYGMYGKVMPDEAFDNGIYTIAWSEVGTILPWAYYLQTGDTSYIEKYWNQMYEFVTEVSFPYAEKISVENGVEAWRTQGGFQHGDWLGLEKCNNTLYYMFFNIYSSDIMQKMGQAIGADTAQLARLQEIEAFLREVFLNNYIQEDGTVLSGKDSFGGPFQDGTVDNAQTALAWVIKLGLYETQAQYQAVQDNLDSSIKNEGQSVSSNRGENTLACGFGGVNVLMPSLSEADLAGTAYDLMNSTNMYSFLYAPSKGATTVWETWDQYTDEAGWRTTGDSNSQNHFSYGAAIEWLFEYAAGIQKDESNPGFKQIILQPETDDSLSYLNSSYDSYYGTIVSNWKAEQGRLTSYETVVPANTTATLYLPISADAAKDFAAIDGVTLVAAGVQRNGMTTVQFELASGGYRFEVTDGTLSVSLAEGFVSEENPEKEADKGILDRVIAYAEAQKEDSSFETVIESVKQTFDAVLEAAKAVASDKGAAQDEVDLAWMNLMREIHKLGFVQGDKASLKTLIDLGTEIEKNMDNYVEAGKTAFLEALTDARAVFADGDMLQQEVDAASSALVDAMAHLRLRADKSLLEKILAEAEAVDTAAYTAETVKRFQSAQVAAKEVYADADVTQQEADDAAAALQAAIASLELAETTDTQIAIRDDQTTSVGSANAKTGDAVPAGMVIALMVLTGAAFVIGKKRK